MREIRKPTVLPVELPVGATEIRPISVMVVISNFLKYPWVRARDTCRGECGFGPLLVGLLCTGSMGSLGKRFGSSRDDFREFPG